MKLRHEISGDLLEVPPPNALGESAILLNGEIIERVLYSDAKGGSVTLGDGRMFATGHDFASYVIGLLGLLETGGKAGKAGGRGRKKGAE